MPSRFSPYSLFWKSENEDQLDAVEAENDRQIGEAALNEGLTLMGVMPTWVLPPFANPPLVPGVPEERHFGSPEARRSCVPERGSSEYSRLSAIRNRMYATLVAEYPSVPVLDRGLRTKLFLL